MKDRWKELDEMVTNMLYRLHFPCDKSVCDCDKIIRQAKKYLEEKVFQEEYK